MGRKQDDSTAPEADILPPTEPSQLLTVAELAEKHGQTHTPVVDGDTRFSRTHLGADAAHGWTRHKAFKSEDVRLTDADYLGALASFEVGATNYVADKRKETTFTPKQAEAKLASDLKVSAAQKKSRPTPLYAPHNATAAAIKKAKQLAESSGTKMRSR